MPFIDGIRKELQATDMTWTVEQPISAWREVSRRLYFDQYGAQREAWRLQDGAEAWLDTTVALFGDRALCLHFDQELAAPERLSLAQRLMNYKRDFRQRRRTRRAAIHVTYQAAEDSYPIYFDGIHVPEPDPNRIAWELEIIRAFARTHSSEDTRGAP
jgi:hypothetical protein